MPSDLLYIPQSEINILKREPDLFYAVVSVAQYNLVGRYQSTEFHVQI